MKILVISVLTLTVLSFDLKLKAKLSKDTPEYDDAYHKAYPIGYIEGYEQGLSSSKLFFEPDADLLDNNFDEHFKEFSPFFPKDVDEKELNDLLKAESEWAMGFKKGFQDGFDLGFMDGKNKNDFNKDLVKQNEQTEELYEEQKSSSDQIMDEEKIAQIVEEAIEQGLNDLESEQQENVLPSDQNDQQILEPQQSVEQETPIVDITEEEVLTPQQSIEQEMPIVEITEEEVIIPVDEYDIDQVNDMQTDQIMKQEIEKELQEFQNFEESEIDQIEEEEQQQQPLIDNQVNQLVSENPQSVEKEIDGQLEDGTKIECTVCKNQDKDGNCDDDHDDDDETAFLRKQRFG